MGKGPGKLTSIHTKTHNFYRYAEFKTDLGKQIFCSPVHFNLYIQFINYVERNSKMLKYLLKILDLVTE